VFASLDPRLISVTPLGVGLSQAIGGLKTTSRVKGPLCPPLGVHPNTHRGLGPTPASRERGPPCPPGGGAHPKTDVRRGAWHVDRVAIRPCEIRLAALSRTTFGVPRVMWGTPTGGVRFARPPAHLCDPYRGRRVVSATASPDDIAAARTEVSAVSTRWVSIHHIPPPRAVHDVHPQPAPKGLKKLAGGRAKRPPPVRLPTNRCTPRGVPESVIGRIEWG
jgi:hypothetical protein